MSTRRLTELSQSDARAVAARLGQPAYRGDQLWSWVMQKGILDTERMSNLPKAFRDALGAEFDVRQSRVVRRIADDGTTTEKILLEVGPNQVVEAVLIMEDDRSTICLSTQVGCPVACTFCASGLFGLERNLTKGEILEQYLVLAARAAELGRRITNVVVMGMGEPMMNVRSLLDALAALNDPAGPGLGARHITVSTIGIRKGLDEFMKEKRQYTLAFSLHAPNDNLRAKIVPFPAAMKISELILAARRYLEEKGREVTFEYVLLDGINSARQQADELASVLKDVRGTLNLIPYNEVPEQPFRRPPDAAIDAFAETLRRRGIKVTVRKRKGHDIAAACGQLRLHQLDSGSP